MYCIEDGSVSDTAERGRSIYMSTNNKKRLLIIILAISQAFIIGACHKQVKLSGYNIAPVFTVEAEKKVMEQEEPVAAETDYSDFSKLIGINPDTVGWLFIPGTKINYPIVQTTDNDRYLHTGFNGEDNVTGSIFLDYDSEPDMTGRNNIIYGHNMKNGTMFRDLIRFKEQDFFEEHKYFQIYTSGRVINLKAISCYYGKADADIRKTEFDSQEEYQEFVTKLIEKCPYAEIPDEPVKSIYIFVTCSYEVNDARTYLIAVEE